MPVECRGCACDCLEWPHQRGKKLLASGREGDAPVGPIEQTDADPRFQALESMAQCRGTDTELQSGATKAAMPRDRKEVIEVG